MTDVPVDANDVLFEARTPLGFSVRVTVARWNLIVTAKHPVAVTGSCSFTARDGGTKQRVGGWVGNASEASSKS